MTELPSKFLCHLGADHTHDPTPDTGVAMAHSLARAVPQVAKETIHAMRLAGVSMGAIPKSIKVGNLPIAGRWQLVCCRRAMVEKPGFRNVVSRMRRQWLPTKDLDCNLLLERCIQARCDPRSKGAIGPNLGRCFTTSTQRCRVRCNTTTGVAI